MLVWLWCAVCCLRFVLCLACRREFYGKADALVGGEEATKSVCHRHCHWLRLLLLAAVLMAALLPVAVPAVLWLLLLVSAMR